MSRETIEDEYGRVVWRDDEDETREEHFGIGEYAREEEEVKPSYDPDRYQDFQDDE